MTKCPHCGADLEPVDMACAACGKSILGEAEWVRTQKLWRESLLPGQTATQTIRSRTLPTGAQIQHPIKLRKVGASTSPDADCDYQLLAMLGQGGMGLVYQARQTSVARSIALKMMKPGKSSDEQRQELFLAEALVTGHLDHPNIVPIYDLGMDEAGHLFYAMKELKGRPWSDAIGHKSIHENLEILLRVCDAVAFAHSRGVIHRDLKPQNVMLGDYGEVVLMDWGLAAATAAGSPALRISTCTALCGTPAYMAPEMAHGRGEQIGPQSDIYLLGAILFEILEGFPPHLTAHDDPMDALTAAGLNKIAKAKAEGELLDIALKAMATVPSDRFESVKDFQAAIRVFREHQESDRLATLARQKLDAAQASKSYGDFAESIFGFRQALNLWPENQPARQGLDQASLQYAKAAMDQGDLDLSLSLLNEEDETQRNLARKVRLRIQERARQTARIRALRRSLALAGTAVLVLATVSAVWINRERIRATRGELAARTALAESRRLLSESLEAAGVERAALGQDAEALALLAAALRQNPSNHVAASRTLDLLNRKDWALPVLDKSRKPLGLPLPPNPFPKRQVDAPEVNPRSIVLQVETTNDPPIPLGDPIGPWEHPATAQATAAISPDGRFVALASGKRRLHVYDRFQSAEAIPPFALPASPWTLEFSPAGDLLVVGLRSGLYRFMDVFSGCSTRRNIFGPPDSAGAFVQNRSHFAMWTSSWTSSPSQIYLVDLRPGNARAIRMNLGGHIETAQFTPDGRGVVLSGGHGDAGVYSIETGEIQAGPVRLGNPCRISAISPDGLRCASATSKGQIILWSLGTGAELARVKAAHTGPIGALAFDPQGRFLASGGDDLQLRLWNAYSLAPITNLAIANTVRSIAVSPDSKYLLAGVGHDAMLWNLESAGTPPENIGHSGWVRAVDLHPDGRHALWADHDRGHIFDLATRTNIAAGGNHADSIWRAEFNPDGQSFATVSFDGFLRLWSLDGKPITSFLQIHDGVPGGASTLTYSRDGRWVAAGAGMGLVRIWDTATGREIVDPLRVASDRISAIDISADKKRIVMASWDGTATIQELVPCEEAPAWLADLAEAVGGFRATGSGYDPLTWSNRTEILSALQKETKTSSDHSVAMDWLRWFLAPRGKRTAGPWSSVTVSETVERLLKSSAPEDIADAVAMAPNNPTCCLHMAEAMLPIDPVRAAFWAASARALNPAITLPPHLAEILAQAPFDETDPPGPEVVHLTAGEVKDYSPYAYRYVVWHGTADFLLSNLGQSMLFFRESEAQLFGSIRNKYIPAIEKTLGGGIQRMLCGRSIRLKGVLVPFKNQWEIQIVDPSQIQIEKVAPPLQM